MVRQSAGAIVTGSGLEVWAIHNRNPRSHYAILYNEKTKMKFSADRLIGARIAGA